MGTAQAPEPDDTGIAENLRLALFDNAVGHLQAAAVSLLCDMPGRLYARPEFAKYLTVRTVTSGSPFRLAEVDWSELGADLIAGHAPIPTLLAADRALLLIAASLAGGPAVHLGALVASLDEHRVNLASEAVRHAGGVW